VKLQYFLSPKKSKIRYIIGTSKYSAKKYSIILLCKYLVYKIEEVINVQTIHRMSSIKIIDTNPYVIIHYDTEIRNIVS